MSYNGTIAELPTAKAGIVTDAGGLKAPAFSLKDANNVVIENGEIRKSGGSAVISAAPVSDGSMILRMLDYFPTPTAQRLLVITNTGKLHKDDGLLDINDTVLSSSLSVSDQLPSMISAGAEETGNPRKVLIATGRDPVKVLSGDGSSIATISNPASDWTGTNQPKHLTLHSDGRVYAVLGDFLYGSKTDDHEDFSTTPGSTVNAIYPGYGDELVCSISALGRLFLFKRPSGIVSFDGSTISMLNRFVGIAGPHAWCPFGDDVIILGTDGQFYLLSAVEELPNFRTRSLNNLLLFNKFVEQQLNLDKTAMSKVQAEFYPLKNRAIFVVPGVGSAIPNRYITFDLSESIIKPLFGDREAAQSITVRQDEFGIRRPIISNQSGEVLQIERESLNVDGSAYTGMFHTQDTDLSYLDPRLGAKNKQFDYVEIVTDTPGNWNLTVEVYVDGVLCDTIAVSLTDVGFVLDEDQLDVDVLGADRSLSRSARLRCYGRSIAFRVYQSGINQGFSISKIFVGFRVGEERTLV